MMCFLKEVMWLYFMFFNNCWVVVCDLQVEGQVIVEGIVFELSLFIQYCLVKYWDDLLQFDFDCWLFEWCKCIVGIYVFYGFFMCFCVGLVVGNVQLVLLCVLLVCEFCFIFSVDYWFEVCMEGFVILVVLYGMFLWCMVGV